MILHSKYAVRSTLASRIETIWQYLASGRCWSISQEIRAKTRVWEVPVMFA